MRTGKRSWGWHAAVEVQPNIIWVWVSGDTGSDVLRAALPREPGHYRSLLTMLEGVALWSGAPLDVVFGADHPAGASLGLGRWGADEVWPEESALVNVFFRHPARPPRRLGRFDACSECGKHSDRDQVW